MSRARASVLATGSVADAGALAHDLSRWPVLVDGFGRLVSADERWPAGGAVVWDSRPGGRGRVVERVLAHDGVRHEAEVEDERLTGVQTLRLAPAGEGRVRIELELRWQLKRRMLGGVLVDWLFVRRAVADSLWRTVRRLAIELEAEAEALADAQPHA